MSLLQYEQVNKMHEQKFPFLSTKIGLGPSNHPKLLSYFPFSLSDLVRNYKGESDLSLMSDLEIR